MQNICSHKSKTSICGQIGVGGEHYKYYKHTKFCKNPRDGLKFLDVDHEKIRIWQTAN